MSFLYSFFNPSVDGDADHGPALALPALEGMSNLQTIRFASSTKGKRSRNFFDVCQVTAHDDFGQLFYQGDLDHYFLEIVRARTDRTWKGVSPNYDGDDARTVRWELELIGESCPLVDQAYLVSSRSCLHAIEFLKSLLGLLNDSNTDSCPTN